MPKVAYRVIRSRNLLPDFDVILQPVIQELDNEVKPALVGLMERRVADWDNQVQFESRKVITNDSISVYVYPVGPNKELWKYVSKGTNPHPIPKTPKGPGDFLQFKFQGRGQSHIPKTTPAGAYGQPSRKLGPVRRFMQVNHPGIEPRNFEKFVKEEYEPEFRQRMENAFRRGIRLAKKQGSES